MLTNFNCGVLYVSKEWEIPKPTEVSDLPSPTNDLLDDEGNEKGEKEMPVDEKKVESQSVHNEEKNVE